MFSSFGSYRMGEHSATEHSMVEIESFKFATAPGKGDVSGLLAYPSACRAMLVLGHGAGSTLGHPLMQNLSDTLNASGVATLRFNYPYSESGRGMDAEAVRLATVRRAAEAGLERARELPVFAGGHSMSGRMMSMAHAAAPLRGVRGIVCFAFPLHSGPPNVERAAHLARVNIPMLFVSGTRDAMADATLLEGVIGGLERARLHWVDTGDHGFKTLKRRASKETALEEAARVTCDWMRAIAAESA